MPEGFTVHPKLLRQFGQRAQMVAEGDVDWALGEALALGSILLEGTDVRLSGQDTRRGTFSQRHAVLVDYRTGEEWVPLAHLQGEDVGRFGVHDSLLSEYAAVGFEYGYSVESPDALVAWEAQFGDFANGAQIIIDNFFVSADDKWGQRSGLVLLLPHGYEGQGPEHSSARIERFLTLCARDNMRLAQPTTAAQYFHLLRSQVRGRAAASRWWCSPPSPCCGPASRAHRSTTSPSAPSPRCSTIPPPRPGRRVWSSTGRPPTVEPAAVRRVLLCSGKVAFDAMARRDALLGGEEGLPEPGIDPAAVAVVRVEQLYPWPEEALAAVLGHYPRRRPGGVGPGGAREHGGVVLRPRAPAPALPGSVHPRPREPGRVGQPGDGECGVAPPRAGGPPPPGVLLTLFGGAPLSPVSPGGPSAQGRCRGSPSSSPSAVAVSVTLTVAMPEGSGRLQVDPEVVEEHGLGPARRRARRTPGGRSARRACALRPPRTRRRRRTWPGPRPVPR